MKLARFPRASLTSLEPPKMTVSEYETNTEEDKFSRRTR